MSQVQIQAVNILAMDTEELRNEIYKAVSENPALEIVKKDKRGKRGQEKDFSYSISGGYADSDARQRAMEATEDHTETLQAHLMHQLNSINLSFDELELSQKLIYNLDKNGFYGTMLAPESLINKARPLQTKEMLDRCIKRIQRMDPVGTCCKTPEESLLVQAQVSGEAPELALFILDGHIDLLNPPEPGTVYKKVVEYQKEWHKKKFAGEIILDKIKFDEWDVDDAIQFILHLNIHPAQDYLKDTNSEYSTPDIVLRVVRKNGPLGVNDYSRGLVTGDNNSYFQIEYASGVLPEVRLVEDFSMDKENYQKAKSFLDILAFRESSIILQGCAIVNAQRDFFLNGTGHINALTRRQIASELGIHESTVSRTSSKRGSKFIQTEWGLFPVSYFFSSGVSDKSGDKKISSQVIKQRIVELLSEDKNLSDSKLAELLGAEGVKIARRTVAKYRVQLGMANSYKR